MARSKPAAAARPRHPIKVVALRTGLSPEVIRAWERRYGAIRPERSPTRRRLYSDEEIERLRLLRRLTRGGRRIGDVAALALDELQRLAGEDRDEGVSPVPDDPADAATRGALAECLEAVHEMNAARLDAVLQRAGLELNALELMDRVILPLLERIGRDWERGALDIRHEHLASAVVRAQLDRLRLARSPGESAPRLVVATPAGQRHELGALMVAVVASAQGWRVSYLGADLPAEEIAAAATRQAVAAVAVSVVYLESDRGVEGELLRLRERLPEEVPLIVGGRAAASYSSALGSIGAHRPRTLHELRELLRSLT